MPVIEGGEHGLAGAGCGHGEVAVTTLRTSVLHLFEHALLVRERVHIQQGRVDIVFQALAFAAGNIRLGQGSIQILFLLVGGGIVGKITALPVALEQALKLADQAGSNRAGDTHIPLQSVSECGTGQVRATHVTGGHASIAVEQPGLRVQAGAVTLVTDFHLRAVLFDEAVNSLAVGRAHVGGGNNAERNTAIFNSFKLLTQTINAGHFKKRAEQIYTVCAF